MPWTVGGGVGKAGRGRGRGGEGQSAGFCVQASGVPGRTIGRVSISVRGRMQEGNQIRSTSRNLLSPALWSTKEWRFLMCASGHLHSFPNTPDLRFGASLPGFFQGWAQMTWDSGPGTHPPLRTVTLVHCWASALAALSPLLFSSHFSSSPLSRRDCWASRLGICMPCTIHLFVPLGL